MKQAIKPQKKFLFFFWRHIFLLVRTNITFETSFYVYFLPVDTVKNTHKQARKH